MKNSDKKNPTLSVAEKINEKGKNIVILLLVARRKFEHNLNSFFFITVRFKIKKQMENKRII